MTTFVRHTIESAPAGSRPFMTATEQALGRLPAAVGLLAESPELTAGFAKVSSLYEHTTLDPVAREVVVMTVVVRNGCHICVAMHSGRLTTLGADSELIEALRGQRPLADPRLDAVRVFTLELLASAGAVHDAALAAFLAHGHTTRNALEVVLGIGTYTMMSFANRLTRAPGEV